MAWSYSGDPSSTQLDELRFWIQDTDPSNPLMDDEGLLYLLGVWMPKTNSVLYAAAITAELLASKFARLVSVSADGVSVQMSELQSRYTALAARLREQYKADGALTSAPYLSGVMWDETRDVSIKPLRFGVGMTDNYEAGRQDYGDYDPGNDPAYRSEVGEGRP